MKKTLITFYTMLLGIFLSVSVTYALDASYIASTQGTPLPLNEVEEVTEGGMLSSNIFGNEVTSTTFTIDRNTEPTVVSPVATASTITNKENILTPLLLAKTLIVINPNIRTIDVEESTISVTRIIPIKLFGVIPMKMRETATVTSFGNSNKEVTIMRPWWNLISSDVVDPRGVSDDLNKRMENIHPSLFTAVLDDSTKTQILSVIGDTFATGSSSQLSTRTQ